jgi:hypothetical protein
LTQKYGIGVNESGMINTGAKKGRTAGTCEYEYWILGAMILLGSPVQEVTQVARFFH